MFGQPPDDHAANDDEDDEDKDDEAPDECALAFLALPLEPVVGLSIDRLDAIRWCWASCLTFSALIRGRACWHSWPRRLGELLLRSASRSMGRGRVPWCVVFL